MSENTYTGVAQLRKHRSSARKMRLVADLIRGKEVEKALAILEYSPRHASTALGKLLKSAVTNLRSKHEDVDLDDATLRVKTLYVTQAGMMKRTRPAPQGRAMMIRKKFNHVYLSVEAIIEKENKTEVTTSTQQNDNQTNQNTEN